MFDILDAVPSSAVATSGTIAFAYPTGRSAGDYADYGHKAQARGLQNALSIDNGDFSITLGASNITFTYRGTTSIPANTLVRLELNIRGDGVNKPPSLPGTRRIAHDPIIRIDLGAPTTLASNAVLTSQDLTAAGVYSVAAFNGAAGVGNAYAQFNVPRNVVAAWTGAAVLTVTGKDEYGNTMVEKSALGTSFTGKKAFYRVTSIAVSANVTALTVGNGDVLGLPVYIEKYSQILAEIEDGKMVGGPSSKTRINWFGEQVSVLAGTNSAIELISPCAGVINKLVVVTRAAVTTGGNITVNTGAGAGTAVVGISVAVANGSAKGTTTTGTATAGDATTVVSKNTRILIVFDDAIATAGALDGYLEIQPTDVDNGTLVVGDLTKPTATTGDVRGTYKPESASNGAKSFSLIAAVSDPTYKGVSQFAG